MEFVCMDAWDKSVIIDQSGMVPAKCVIHHTLTQQLDYLPLSDISNM